MMQNNHWYTFLVAILFIPASYGKNVFTTTRDVNQGLNFLVIGDWGGLPTFPYSTDVEISVAKMMAKTADQTNAKFVVALGDNFYFDGVETENDIRFAKTFEDVYSEKSLQIPWYVIAGNHDHHRNVSAQIDYSNISPRWKFPKLYHSHLFKIPGTSKVLQLILIDTVILCGNSGHDHHPKPLRGPDSPELATEQLEWLENELSKSTADYIVVGGHYPVWSIGNHGPTMQLVKQLRPLFEKYSVTTYICGHDHNLQSLKEQNSTIAYHVVGCANFIDPRTTHHASVPDGSSKFFWADLYGGFAVASVDDEKLLFTFMNNFGKVLYQAESLPRKSL